MQISMLLVFAMLHSSHCLQMLTQSTKETCFTVWSKVGDRINLHIFNHNQEEYKYLQYFILDPDMRAILKRGEINNNQTIVRSQLKAKKNGKYQLCVKQTDNVERVFDIAFQSSGPISQDSSIKDDKVLDEVNFQAVLIDFDKDYTKSQELIDDLDISQNNHMELVRFMDNHVEEIKEYQYVKVYLVVAMLILQIIVFTFILRNKQQLSVV